jgi:hypothetical protein
MQVCSTELTKALAPYDSQVCSDDSPLPLKPCNVGIFGKKGTGKSNLILNMIMKKESPWYKHFDLIFLCSPTAVNDDKMAPLIEDIDDQYYDTLNNDVLEDIIAKTEAYTERRIKKGKKGKPNYCIIFDDCIHLIKSKQANLITKLATQNRHMNITNIYLLQKYNSYMPTLIRSNLDCIMFFHTENQAELDSFVKEVGTNEHKLRKLYDFATAEPYSFLFVNTYTQPVRYFRRFDPIEWKAKQ